jgi:hypothetical protein
MVMTAEEKRAKHTERKRRWRAANPERVREQKRKWNAKSVQPRAEYNRVYREKNRERLNAQKMEHYYANRDSIRAKEREKTRLNPGRHTPYKRKWARKNPDKCRASQKKYRYGLTLDQVGAMLAGQGGACGICRTPIDERTLKVDHCHKTDVVRGLLCFHCNIGIGNLRDDPERLRKAAAYLEASRAEEIIGW